MSTEIEIEFKNLLTQSEFETLKNHFSITEEDFVLQHNYYFDTPAFILKKESCALRVREKNNRRTLTLKQPHSQGLLETHQPLTVEEVNKAIQKSTFPEGEVTQVLSGMKIHPNQLRFLGKLSTYRAEVPYQNGTLVLDYSLYLDTSDHELEYEAGDKDSGLQTFKALTKAFNIPHRETPNKIRRFFNQL